MFGLAIDSIKQFGLFNADKVESVVLGIIVLVVLSWLTLTAYTLFREPKLLKHWNYTNLGLLGVIAIFGISSFLVVVMIFLALIVTFLPALGTLSDLPFFAFAFFTGFYMLLMLFSRKNRNKTSDMVIVPKAVAQVIGINGLALSSLYLLFFLLASVKYALNTGEWVGFLVLVWMIIGFSFLGLYAGIAILSMLSIKTPKRLKAGSSVSSGQIRIINRLFLVALLLASNFLYGVNSIIHIAAIAVILFVPLVAPEKIKRRLRLIFVDRFLDGVLTVISVLLIITPLYLRGEIRWFNLITGLVLLGGTVLYLLSLKEVRDFVKQGRSRMQKWFRKLKKLVSC